MTELTTAEKDKNNSNSTTAVATTTADKVNDDGDTMAVATMMEATDEDCDTTAAAATTEATMTESTTANKADNDDDNDGDRAATTTEEMPAPISIDQPESAATEVEEAREQLLLDATKHVKMAREQSALHQAHVAEAVCDATDGKSHYKQRYSLVVDYGQNMQVPIFNNEQPGSTYFFSPLSVYNLGMVDHAHVNK